LFIDVDHALDADGWQRLARFGTSAIEETVLSRHTDGQKAAARAAPVVHRLRTDRALHEAARFGHTLERFLAQDVIEIDKDTLARARIVQIAKGDHPPKGIFQAHGLQTQLHTFVQPFVGTTRLILDRTRELTLFQDIDHANDPKCVR
jgi:hypothetical protein